MDFEELERWRTRVERRLALDFTAAIRRDPKFRADLKVLEEFTLRGGKRYRALLVLAGYHLATHRDPTVALPAAAAMEHFQSWMLIHDDIMDHAETRRGGPTVHREYEREHASHGWADTDDSFGAGMGITLGDLAEPLTVQSILGVRVPVERRQRALEEFARMTRLTAYGQLLDIRTGVRPIGEVRESDVLSVHRLKTSVYTVAAPFRIGAILGGGSPALLADLDAIGTDLGIAFQLRDDVLGAGFDRGASGKSANDLLEGKRTLLVVRAWAAADAVGRDRLGAVLGRRDAPAADVAAVQELIRSTGSLDYSERRIHAIGARAEKRIRSSPRFRTADRELLGSIADRLLHRVR